MKASMPPAPTRLARTESTSLRARGGDSVLHLRRKLGFFQELRDDLRLVATVERTQAAAQRTGLTRILVENHGTAKGTWQGFSGQICR